MRVCAWGVIVRVGLMENKGSEGVRGGLRVKDKVKMQQSFPSEVVALTNFTHKMYSIKWLFFH